jgi:type I restriction enzyme S subunit
MSKLLHGCVRTIVLELTRGLESLYGERLRGVFVFGSYARDEAVEGSDLDVAVILDDFEDQWEEIQRTSHFSSELSLKYGLTIAIVQIREKDWVAPRNPFLATVRAEAISL